MLQSMTARQLYEWMTFADFEPFGEARADARTGMLVQLLANVYRDRAEHPARYTLRESVPMPTGDSFGESALRPTQTWQEMKAIGMLVSGMTWEE